MTNRRRSVLDERLIVDVHVERDTGDRHGLAVPAQTGIAARLAQRHRPFLAVGVGVDDARGVQVEPWPAEPSEPSDQPVNSIR